MCPYFSLYISSLTCLFYRACRLSVHLLDAALARVGIIYYYPAPRSDFEHTRATSPSTHNPTLCSDAIRNTPLESYAFVVMDNRECGKRAPSSSNPAMSVCELHDEKVALMTLL